jgi:hypothetical protein
MADEAKEFWDAFESETGEKVEARSIGEYYKDGNEATGIWGLVVLTDKSLRFRHMPSDNWFSSLFKRADRSSKEAKAPIDLAIARADILSMEGPKRGFIARLFGPAFHRFAVIARSGEGERRYLFSIDPSSDLVPSLEKTLAAPKA